MYIEKIEIQYFRSIYRETITGLKLLNVFTGKNDAGKSNVLKALNLFFNNETDTGTPFSFVDDYNFQRLREVRRESIKGKQYIQIKVTFIRGNRFEKTLPERFTVSKRWLRTDILPSVVSNDLEKRLTSEGKRYNDRNKSSLTAYLNKIRYIYVPAIKDDETFNAILTQLRETIYNDKLENDNEILASMAVLEERTSDVASELSEEFELATGIKTNLSTPKRVSELYQALGVDTHIGENIIELDKRGDGIRVRYLPSILYYIARNSSHLYIWGFEEPENSLEYNLALKMAEDFRATYCNCSMVFVTSHSPAFIGLSGDQSCELYRCYQEGNCTKIVLLSRAEEMQQLSEELGYIRIQNELYSEYRRRVEEFEKIKHQKTQLEEELQRIRKPVLYTEGITDVLILNTAWNKLFGDRECPFEIKSCNVLDEAVGSSAGCDILKELLITTRPDCPQIVIGLFDRDAQGKKAFQLSANFDIVEDGWKRHKNKRANGLLLPIPPGKEQFDAYSNLCIEFYFEKNDIDKTIDGRGLKLRPVDLVQTFHGISVTRRTPTELHFFEIDKSTKRFFAETIVPSLPEESFVHFRRLFQKIEQIITLDTEAR